MEFSQWLKSYPELIIAVVSFAAFLLGYLIRIYIGKASVQSSEKLAKKIVDDAQHEAHNLKREVRAEAKEEIYKARTQLEKEIKTRQQEVIGLEKRVIQKEEAVDKRMEVLHKKEGALQQHEKLLEEQKISLHQKQDVLDRLINEEKENLQKISNLTREEARRMLLDKVHEDVRQESAAIIKQIESEARESADKTARWVVGEAIHRVAIDHVKESTTTTVSLPDDEIKGKIIGREGRNIRAFENITGVDLIIDDTPEVVIISAFDMMRREIARISLERLILDGRIHPVRIEEIVEKVKKEIDESIQKNGEDAVFELGLHGLNPELVKLLGRLKFRTSYGQNVLSHSKEVAWLMGVMCAEMGMDAVLGRRMGLIHDVGKTMSHEVEGNHALIGGNIAKKYNESAEVVHAVSAHHTEIEAKSVYAMLLQAADAISAARPGARSDTVERYIHRLQDLENIACSFKGVEKSYAIQAGREVRVLVKPEDVDDALAIELSHNIAKKIQGDLDYPGIIKVTVVRESRAVGYAR
ncbi:MAG: ribonuclease Y [Chlamydiota bacterium]|nr:ribonuclease Y [Chlamydiota bacterium]